MDADGDGSGTAVVTKFAYEAGNVWADLNGSGSLTTRRIYGFGADNLLARIGSSNNEDWYLTDRLGSVRDIVNSSGSLIDHIDYTAFGTRTQTSSANGDRYGFTSREHDDEWSGLYYRARYMLDGRWLQEDPMGFAAGDANLRRYVGNNATNGTDPSGMFPVPSVYDLNPGMIRPREELQRIYEDVIQSGQNYFETYISMSYFTDVERRYLQAYHRCYGRGGRTISFDQYFNAVRALEAALTADRRRGPPQYRIIFRKCYLLFSQP